MGKSKKGRCGSEKEETLEDDDERGGGGFYGCYLLISLSPRHKGHTYIGFTVNPKRRIRQHNGEMRSGAWRTKSKRPWEMALLIYGFPTNVAALQFEWAWQHPIESLAVRKAAVTFKSLSGIANKIKLALTMLTLPAWGSLNLTVNFFSTKYKKHCAGCPSLPEHMKVQICSMDELPCYNNTLLFDEKNVCREDDEWDIESDDGQAAVDTNLAEHDGNSEGVEAGGDRKQVMETFHSSADCNHSRIEEATKEESSSKELKRDSQGDDALLLLPSKFPDTILFSSFATSSSSCIAEAVERGMFSLREEECIVEPARKDLPIRASADEDQPTLLRSPTVTCDVEVIDLFTPSPSLQTKKRTVFSEIIDLTKSPTFV